MKRIICRADGNEHTGLGHLYRMFALYEMYKEHFEMVFVTRADTTGSVIPGHYKVEIIPTEVKIEDEHEFFLKNFPAEETIIIADGYQFTSAYQFKIKEAGYYLVYVDDLTSEKMFADIVINHSPHVTEQHFKTNGSTKFSLGTRFAILRPSFLEAAGQPKELNELNKAFICFGGADMYDLTLATVQALLEFSQVAEIHAILGGAYKHNEIYKLAEQQDNIFLYQNVNEDRLIEIMKNCNFGIAPSSTILYELCCVKMPLISGFFVDNQKYIYQGFSEDGLILGCEDFSEYGKDDFKLKIKELFERNDLQEMINSQARLFDKNIKKRFLGMLAQVSFREATSADSKLLFNWTNDALVRKQSYSSEKIEFESHDRWFRSKIEDVNQLFLIAKVGEKEAGLVRYSIEDNNAVVGISVSSEFRGMGLAPKFLSESAKYYFKTNALPIFAYIKKENIASIKSFEKAGYKFLKEEVVKGFDSKIYQLSK